MDFFIIINYFNLFQPKDKEKNIIKFLGGAVKLFYKICVLVHVILEKKLYVILILL